MQRNLETFFPSSSYPAVGGAWPPPQGPSTSGSTTDDDRLAKAVIATAASTFAFWGFLFFLLYFFVTRRQQRRQAEEEGAKSQPEKISLAERIRSRASRRKSVFVDEDGLDAVYWREFKGKVGSVHSDVDESLSGQRKDDDEGSVGPGYTDQAKKNDWRIQEERLLPAGFIGSTSPVFDDRSSSDLPLPPNQRLPPPPGRFVPSALRPQAALPELRPPRLPLLAGIGNTNPPRMPSPLSPSRDLSSAPRLATASEVRNTRPPRPPSPSRVISSPSPPVTVTSEVSYTSTPPPHAPAISPSTLEPKPSASPPPPPTPPSAPVPKPSAAPPTPPLPPAKRSDPAPHPSLPTSKASAKAPPPPPPLRPPPGKPPGPAPPPPPPGGRPGGGSSRPPPASRPTSAVQGEGGAKKLKPLHWDKMNAINVEHSMVWDKLHSGSFSVDEDIMEALFGTEVANKKAANNSGNTKSKAAAVVGFTPITLLDPRKSQNIAIVLRSTTAVNRQSIIEGAIDGRGLSTDVLERFITIAPTKEEEDVIRAYSGDPGMLADAENFLFHILRAVPAAPFARLDAMLFRANYEPELGHLKQTLRTLEAACGELRTPTRGLFLKLLETVLKAGNRMNTGTARGNAQAFNLTALRKLADVKSTDGSTTLLHFVVEEVVRSEGKRLVINNRGHNSGALERAPSWSSSAAAAQEEREKEYTMLGLPLVGGLSDEFANLKKAAGFDFDALKIACPTLQARVEEIKRLVESLSAGGEGSGGFVKEMRAFMETAKGDLKATAVEQGRVMEVVKKTNEYYHPGAAKERDRQPLHLFVVVKDFLDMVDKACVDIARNLQKKKQAAVAVARSGAEPTVGEEGAERRRRPVARFPNLPLRFLKSNSKSDSSSDEED
ncbi:formin-like protein 16 [Zingiber officinale]|uniref:Formin-like protein n=1 Tax=Zingiber officinale TaxID=94328 RepID=A0A8J5F7I3_ZINOF|nr:formin-like protein 16 [Zingiber officinale]KAG6481334.1 hypothetical protein ZIOFF_057931 [Zingiber officinale]